MTADPASYEVFYAAERDALVRLAFLLTGSADAAEELAQEALLAVLCRWDDLENPPAFARTVLVNLTRSFHRRRFRRDRVRPSAPLRTELPPELDETWSAIRSLPPTQRSVVVLRFYEDLSLEQTARVLDRPVGTVKSLQHRALARLKEILS